jgi:hypothetical protein
MKTKENLIEERASGRLPVKIEARFFFNGVFCVGSVSNISETGMFIKTRNILPPDSLIITILKAEHGLLKVIAGVKWILKQDRCAGMGVELVNTPKDYLALVNNIGYEVR